MNSIENNSALTQVYQEILKKPFSRGFLFAKLINEKIDEWKTIKINDFYLHYDPICQVTVQQSKDSFMIFIGEAINVLETESDSISVPTELIKRLNNTEEEFYSYLDVLNGRFSIIYKSNLDSDIKVLNDACGLRSVFYTKSEEFCLASHPALLAKNINAKKNDLHKYLSMYTGYHLPGNTTTYENVYQLIPNHYYSDKNKRLVRFFPRKKLEASKNINDTRKSISLELRNQIKNLRNNHNLLCSITAGIDSRVTLSAMREFASDVDFFTYFGGKGDSEKILSVDKKVVSEIVKNLNLKHLFFEIGEDKCEESLALQKKTLSEAHITHNSTIALEYTKRFREKNYLHIRSNLLEIGRCYYRNNCQLNSASFNLDSAIKCYSSLAVNDLRVREIFSEFLGEIKLDDICEGYDPFDLFYWEYRMGIWHSMVLLESDSAFETHIVFNSRTFFENLLSIPACHRNDNQFFLDLCNDNWPVLNYWGVNKDYTLNDLFHKEIHCPGNAVNLASSIIKSGSSDHGVNIEFSSIIKETSASFNLADSAPKKGDYVSLFIDIKKLKSTKGQLIVYYRTPSSNINLPGRIEVKIYKDGKEEHSRDVSECRETNKIEISYTPADESLEIQVKAVRNCEPWSWGKAGKVIVEKLTII
ncbi:hypothetical protein Q7I21_02505 [Aeromonas veronii]|uniref:hypothetical protein n=1 Tax=Aeromonas veronii TaxID=654 RepID=UPI0030068E95